MEVLQNIFEIICGALFIAFIVIFLTKHYKDYENKLKENFNVKLLNYDLRISNILSEIEELKSLVSNHGSIICDDYIEYVKYKKNKKKKLKLRTKKS